MMVRLFATRKSVAVALALAAALCAVNVADATGGYSGNLDCQHPEIDIWSSTACLDSSQTGTQVSAAADLQIVALDAPSNAIRRTIMRTFSGSNCTWFVDSGYYDYPAFDTYQVEAFTVKAASSDGSLGTVHPTYEIHNSYGQAYLHQVLYNTGDNSWRLLVPDDNGDVYEYRVTGGNLGVGSCQSMTGFEETDSPADGVASQTVVSENLSWVNISNGSASNWYDNDHYTDYPCYLNGNTPPKCLNGSWYGQTSIGG
jgi:hypothetical protein